MKLLFILLLIPISFAFAESEEMQNDLSYEKYMPGENTSRVTYFDYSKLDFNVFEVKKTFIPKWVNEPGDFSNILQVKFNVTNNGLDNFVVYKDMFQIDVIDPRIEFQKVRVNNEKYLVDYYYPEYSENFKLRFKGVQLPQNIQECERLQHSVKINQTKSLSVCFDVKQLWSNEPLDLNGPRLYYLVMMDNKFATSCPNCKSVLLNEHYKNPIDKLELAPKTQINLGIPINEISCKKEMQLVFKKTGEPACVKPTSVQKLAERGWIK
jgi:hypothetical protein